MDIVRRWYETDDTTLLADDVDWQVLESFPTGGRYKGRSAVSDRFFPAVKGHFSEYVTLPEIFLTEGPNVATFGVYRVRSAAGKAGDISFAHFWTVRDGRITAFRQVADTAALRTLLAAEDTSS
ncbi:nuclear transport factor 2 family protein [Gluconacetobacter azotocaptans]|uniref:nuclear transport factor 2 family protein n=1 Tax=Gluconacetobacter azotocaptans TaxID=142834 RepID=UPI00195A6927|nr:nuclear transport factor 2 family protein [Gluconacetobacter azotocaptans]MBM9400084.1 nuclear transport factor 2 family protein [Gluconacetobacter azotocaptans]